MSSTSGGEYCGQNVYNSWSSGGPSSKKGLSGAVQKWYDEVKDFDKAGVNAYNSGSDTGTTGHYTQVLVCSIYLFYHATATDTLQVVWGSVTKIGCGYIYRIEPDTGKHPGWYRETIVCNYCKGGNMGGSKMYITGTAGSACPADHPNNKDGLCAE